MAQRLEGYVPPNQGGYPVASVRTYAPGDPDAPREELSEHQRMRRDHGLAQFAPFRSRSSFTSDEQPRLREALKIWGDLLPADERKRLSDAVRVGIVFNQPQQPVQPAPDPADVARALRKLADRVEQGDPEAARRIVAAARD